MLDSFPIILTVGTVLGFLAGLGIGGGSLLILWLTMVLQYPQPDARSINLLFFLPSAIIACFFRWKQGTLNLKVIFPAAIAGCISAAAFSWLGNTMELSLIRKLFGLLLIGTGLREVFYKGKLNASGKPDTPPE